MENDREIHYGPRVKILPGIAGLLLLGLFLAVPVKAICYISPTNGTPDCAFAERVGPFVGRRSGAAIQANYHNAMATATATAGGIVVSHGRFFPNTGAWEIDGLTFRLIAGTDRLRMYDQAKITPANSLGYVLYLDPQDLSTGTAAARYLATTHPELRSARVQGWWNDLWEGLKAGASATCNTATAESGAAAFLLAGSIVSGDGYAIVGSAAGLGILLKKEMATCGVG